MEAIVSGLEFFHKGGMIMYVLALCSLFSFAIAIERWNYFQKNDSGRAFAREFAAFLMADKAEEAVRLAQNTKGALAGILAAACGMKQEENPSGFMEVQSGVALSHLRQRLYYLSVIVTMAPLLGLLGTISGMISAFSVFNIESGQSTAITGGVGEALIATAMGLCVAIISLAIHAYFTQRLENIVTDMEQCFSVVETKHSLLSKKAGA